ncbi:bifunctional aspartate kinase/homoserine dehydrogenase I [Aureibaculum sp. 2210JD6-5]|uniref:bifunctional aspartate kinase/homoserine dehydrogenase I n=1 Tax=Aureibaculum sp. 2210JD6-5 TaxID=3103957 RepID=UPI002AAD9478|nr:bifunctional aspartate kinase/homoserine dehydrogenase I [Aureibaculum sp. 2210JD6-5]MDY7395510.1 bifunctional aspartate kinase/homoserine dehydrogenase I [Aureibaculum sp. 2210JD6-5]
MKVLKFGGTSVGSSKNIKKIIEIVASNQEEKQLIVVSAFAKVTNLLLEAAQLASIKKSAYTSVIEEIRTIHVQIISELFTEKDKNESLKFVNQKLDDLSEVLQSISLISELSAKSEANIVSYGEILSSFVITKALQKNNFKAVRKDTRELILTNTNYTSASVNFEISNKQIQAFFKSNKNNVTVLPGFIAAAENGDTTVLGRGGSDYTASIIAAAIHADILEIWTDVSGMFTANPSLVQQAMPIEQISYEEAMELSHFGAKVIYPPTIHPVLQKEIPIRIKNTLKPKEKGTLITKVSKDKKNPVKGISHIDNVTLITLEGSGMVGIPGFSKRLFETLAAEKINVKLITQASSEHSICIGIDDSNANLAKIAIDNTFEFEILKNKIKPLQVEKNLSIIAIVGDQMKSHQGISGKMFGTLGKNNVNIRAIAQGASEKNISAVIAAKDVKKGINSLHESFFKNNNKQLNLFITGVGNVGAKLIEQIAQQYKFLLDNLNINIRIVGLSNSRKMIFDDEGLNLANWQKGLENGEKASLNGFLNRVKELNLRNSVFVDITANEKVADIYTEYLKNSTAVVACNKIASSASFKKYKELKELSREYDVPYLFETNVGAGLPIIDTLNNLIASGDQIHKIQAVLSGSLNFIFNNFNAKTEFYDVVKQAQEEGYTEPDPRIDLSGVDVARKILILARESGIKMNLEDIENNSFLTENNHNADSVGDFYNSLKKDAPHFKQILKSANNNNCQLKYVAELIDGKAKVGLKEIPVGHPFYNLEGKDNIVMFYTKRYPEQPMIIKGAGAGADVTASGLFADIIKIANN